MRKVTSYIMKFILSFLFNEEVYFFFNGLKDFFLHFLHLTFPSSIFIGPERIFVEQLLQTKMFLKSLFVASGIFAIINCHNFRLTIFSPSTFQYSTFEFSSSCDFISSSQGTSMVSKLSKSMTLTVFPSPSDK